MANQELRDFLVGLATDHAKLGQFIRDPKTAMSDAGLSPEDETALKSGDPMAIHARLTGQELGVTAPTTVLIVDLISGGGGKPDIPMVRAFAPQPAALQQTFAQQPQLIFPQVQPQIFPQVQPQLVFPQVQPQIFPQVHPQLVFPQVQPQIFPQVHPQIFPQVHPQIFPQVQPQIFPQVHPQLVFPQVQPQIFPQVHPQLVFPQVQPQIFPQVQPQLVFPQVQPQIFPQVHPQLVDPTPR